MQTSFCICILAILFLQEASLEAKDQATDQSAIKIESDPMPWLLSKDRDYLNSNEYLEFLKKKFSEVEPAERLGDCKTLIPQRRLEVVLADPILRHIDPDGRRTPLIRQDEFKNNPYSQGYTGAWYESWEVDICGRTATRGLAVLKREGSGWIAMPMVPGTLADMRLQIDTLKIAFATFHPPECDPKSKYIVLGAEPLDTSQFAFHIWKEAWTISRCGTKVTRTITFGPGAAPGGTQMTVEVPPK